MTIEREAAERRRRHKEARVAAESPYYDDDPSPSWPYSWQLDKDARELADAYLRDNPADSDEAITEEWLRSVGFKCDDERPFMWINDKGPPRDFGFDLMVWNDGQVELADSDNSIIVGRGKPLTRGELRALCRVLKIPLPTTAP